MRYPQPPNPRAAGADPRAEGASPFPLLPINSSHPALEGKMKQGRLSALALTLLFSACGDTATDDDSPEPPCANVTCDEGSACSEEDGECHCGAENGPICLDGTGCDPLGPYCTPTLESHCTDGSYWEAGAPAFREATSEWGLEALAVTGLRLSVTDFDADGWADLFIRHHGTGTDDFSEGGGRRTWLLRNTGDGTFEDVTEASGLLTTRYDYGTEQGRPVELVAWGDVNNDGLLDVFTGADTTNRERSFDETSELMLNGGDGNFYFGASQGLFSSLQSPAGASFVDYDRDGNLDLWVTQNAPSVGGSLLFLQDRLFRGDGTGSFTDVTEEAGLVTAEWSLVEDLNNAQAHSWAWSSAACDLNDDGVPELLAASYGRAPNHLWQGEDEVDGTVFVNRSVDSGYAFDADQTWTDNQYAACYCRANPTAEGCEAAVSPMIDCSTQNWDHEQSRQAFRLGGVSGTTVCADIDNDQDLDLLTTEIQHWWAGVGADHSELLINTGEDQVRFERPGRESMGIIVDHLGRVDWDEGHMTAAVFDFDNDGWQDFYIGASDYPGNRGLLYHQEAPLSFTEVALAAGIDHDRSHGILHADFDRDGDLDLVLGHSRARCYEGLPNDCYPTSQVRYFENLFGQDGNWLQLRLTGGDGANTSAIGARVTIDTGATQQTREVGGGHGHFGVQHDLVLHFGLGDACDAEVTVRWPDQTLTTQSFRAQSGYRYALTKGRAPVVE